MKRLLIDLSSIAKTGLYEGKDQEFGFEVEHEGKQVWVNGWQHGYERFVGYVTEVMSRFSIQPHNVIIATEGKMSKARRKAIYPLYNESRQSRPDASNDQFNTLRERICTSFRNIGAQIVTQDGVEADDVIAYLAKTLKGERYILSNDGDMAALIGDGVTLIRKGTPVTENPCGPFDTKFITLYKALVGDKSDNIKGAVGFGETAFLDFLVWADEPGLAALEGMIKRKTLHELEEDVAEFKPLRKIIDGAKGVYDSYQVALLHPEWVNTLRQPLQWKAGIVRGQDVVTDERLRPYAQSVRLITSENYDDAIKFLKKHLPSSPIVALDIETSTPEESDEWLMVRGAEAKVDVFGSELTGLGLTFGANGQYTFYFSVDHRDTPNVTSEQVRQAVALVPDETYCVVHNASFELPILAAAWGEKQADNGWHGFLPNVLDTKNLSSYADENLSAGLKKLSAHYLGYEQETYQEVTTAKGPRGTLPAGGQIIGTETVYAFETVLVPASDTEDAHYVGQVKKDEAGEPIVDHVIETRQYKMNELTGEHVLSYGADDTICTSALYHFFRIILEIEGTWDVMVEVEQLPAYVTALAFHQGTKFDLEAMKKMEAEDAAKWDEHWQAVRQFLFDIEWPGTRCPVFKELDAKSVKESVFIILGQPLETQVRKLNRLAEEIRGTGHDDAEALAELVLAENVSAINEWMAQRFTGEPVLDTDSPKMMKQFLYGTLGLPVRIVGSCTPLERKNKRELAAAVSRYKKIWAGSQSEQPLTKDEMELLKDKAKTNEIAIAFAIEMDGDNPHIHVLKHIQAMKKCETRRKLYYGPYANLRHWKDNKIHAQVNQNGTITRRYSSSDPNLQQLPKKGEGVKFRRCFLPHKPNAVICSVDFAGQELRQGAGQSMDANMLACFVGDNLKDMHSMTAAGAMAKKWGKTQLAALMEQFGQEGDDDYALFLRLRKMKENAEVAKMADDLRKNAKNVNFGAQYDAQAPKLAETLIIPVADAEAFLQAKYAMFPRFEEWKEEVKAEAQKQGYVTTPMGARRHLRDALLSDEWGVADKALRQGPNFKIQGGSAEQTKLAMARLWKSGILFNLDMIFFAPIHDELCWSVVRGDAVESCRVVNEVMTVPYGNLPVPFLGSISLGLNFGDQIECGDEFDAASIEAALGKAFEDRLVA